MSGTSLDGVDGAIIETDGETVNATGACLTKLYPQNLRQDLQNLLAGKGDIPFTEQKMTIFHAELVNELLQQNNLKPSDIDVIGFHGQTIMHRPAEGITWQIGNGALLAELTGIDVVTDFRRRDVAAGGQGAPLVPIYHAAIVSSVPRPVAIVNIGGVSNVTWIGKEGELIAFDTGPGNALIDDLILARTGKRYDQDGAIAASGQVNHQILELFLKNDFFQTTPPKSLDRNHFHHVDLNSLSLGDAAATLTYFTAKAIKLAVKFFPAPPEKWIICGGGTHNAYLMSLLRAELGKNLATAEEIGIDSDAVEAQAFAFLAVRSLYSLPISFPLTTGVARSLTGGAFYRA